MKATRKTFSLLLIGLLTFGLGACDKDDDKEETTNTPNNPGGGSAATCATAQFCMNYGGTEKFGDASFISINAGRKRVYWSSGSEQMEVDIYGTAIGAYPISTTGNPGTAAMQYFDGTNATDATNDTLFIVSFDTSGTGISGNFKTTMMDGTVVTNGAINGVK